MSDMKTLVSVVTDNECLWLGEAWAACLCRGTSESYRSQAFDQGSVVWERRLKETSPGATKDPFCFFSLAFPSLFIFRESGWGEHGSVGKQQSWLSLLEPDLSHTLTRCERRPKCSLSLWSIMQNIWCHERKSFDTQQIPTSLIIWGTCDEKENKQDNTHHAHWEQSPINKHTHTRMHTRTSSNPEEWQDVTEEHFRGLTLTAAEHKR